MFQIILNGNRNFKTGISSQHNYLTKMKMT
jgi:hypothetical protein